VTLGDVAEVALGQSPPSETYNFDGVGPPVLQGKAESSPVSPTPERFWSTAGRLTLSVEILTLPRPLAEHVVVHELVHLLVPNHGKVFKSFLFAYLPDWRDRDCLLREFGPASSSTSDPGRAGA